MSEARTLLDPTSERSEEIRPRAERLTELARDPAAARAPWLGATGIAAAPRPTAMATRQRRPDARPVIGSSCG